MRTDLTSTNKTAITPSAAPISATNGALARLASAGMRIAYLAALGADGIAAARHAAGDRVTVEGEYSNLPAAEFTVYPKLRVP